MLVQGSWFIPFASSLCCSCSFAPCCVLINEIFFLSRSLGLFCDFVCERCSTPWIVLPALTVPALGCLRWAQAMCYIQYMNEPRVYIGTQEGFLLSSLLCIKFYLLVCLLLVPELVVSIEPIISHTWSASLHAQNQDLFSLSASLHTFKNLSFVCHLVTDYSIVL